MWNRVYPATPDDTRTPAVFVKSQGFLTAARCNRVGGAVLKHAVSGLAMGGVYAILALALVMIYQATHLVNFAQGQMAMFSTYIAWAMIDAGAPIGLRSR